jgi:aspartate-semialdehyde dehydrogenase
LDERNFPVERLVLLAGERSAEARLLFAGKASRLRWTEDSFTGVDIALFSAGPPCRNALRLSP